jgi:predicted DNA-binding transcriptional regulator AlpA
MDEQLKETLKKLEQYALLQAKEALDISDLSMLTGWSKKTIYNMIYKQQIPYYKNHGVRFKKSEINDWLLTNRHKTLDEINSIAMLMTK